MEFKRPHVNTPQRPANPHPHKRRGEDTSSAQASASDAAHPRYRTTSASSAPRRAASAAPRATLRPRARSSRTVFAALRGVRPARRYGSAYTAASARGGLGGPATKLVAAVAGGLALAVVFLVCYWTMWRSVDVTVNDKTVGMRIGSNAEEFLKANDYFGVAPGKLLSVGGNVLEEEGGERCALTVDDREVPAKKLAETELAEGAVMTVAAGADKIEPYTSEATDIAPGVERKVGGAIQYIEQWARPGKQEVWTGERSGETVDKGVTEEPQNLIIGSRNAQPKKGKYMALTFDDGPSKYTPQVLDILKEKGVKATFYNLGQNAENFPEYAKRVVDEGHEMASHTNVHKELPKLSRDDLRADITTAFDRIEAASGVRTQMMRAPYGAFDQNCWLRAADIISCNVLWNIDTEDWKRPGAAALIDTVVGNAFNGAIVLMHDGGGDRSQNVEALPGIIDGLRDAGYKLVTVGELMELDGDFPKEVYTNKVSVPEGAVIPEA